MPGNTIQNHGDAYEASTPQGEDLVLKLTLYKPQSSLCGCTSALQALDANIHSRNPLTFFQELNTAPPPQFVFMFKAKLQEQSLQKNQELN